jgi:hypothetical protein
MHRHKLSRWVATAVFLSACGDGDFDSTSDARGGDFGFAGTSAGTAGTTASGNQGPGSGAGTGAGSGDGVVDLPPEVEELVNLLLPQASENFVYATNPSGGTVAVIDAKTLTIRTLETGDQPTYLRTLAGSDDAIVLNIGSDTASLIRSTPTSSTTHDVEVVRGANAISVSPTGKNAVVYFNSTYASAGGGSGSFQDLSVLALSEEGLESTSMTVGFRPREVFFADDGKRAFVVTEDGVSVLNFATIAKERSGIAPLVSFGGGVNQKTLDVAVTPNGRYALGRDDTGSVLHLVDLQSGAVRTLDIATAYAAELDTAPDEDGGVPVPVDITDLDLTPDGKAAVAVLRNQGSVLLLPLPAAFDDPSKGTLQTIADEVVGSVTVSPQDGNTALLYTTATDAERITIVSLDKSAPPRPVRLQKTVQAVTFTPDGAAALIAHRKTEGGTSGLDPNSDEFIDRSFGYSLLEVSTGRVKLQVTQAKLGPAVMAPDGAPLFLLFRDDALGIREVHRVPLSSFQADPIISLESPPISLGIAPASKRVFVNQDHPDGRMTFIEWERPSNLETVTGFELNSRIRD